MSQSRVSLHSLPPELVEEVLIISTLLNDTYAAANLAQTCRHFRALVYHQFHKYLWREMFLVVFDNPCPAHKVRTHGRAPRFSLDPSSKGKGKSNTVDDYPWEDEYKRRIWTESFILRRTRPPLDPPASRDTSIELPSTDAELYTVLQTLLHVISTAAPLPYDALARMESHRHPCSPSHPHPIFAPLFVAAHARPTVVLGSRNTTWLARVLAHGLPRALMARLTVFNENGKVDVQKSPVKWDGLLAKLVAQIGLMTPITSSSIACPLDLPPHTVVVIPHTTMPVDDDDGAAGGVANTSTTTAREEVEGEDGDGDERVTRDFRNRVPDGHDLSSGDNDSDFEPYDESASESDEGSESDIDGDEVLGTTATPATTPNDDVRRLARIRVYNMAYLHPSRVFGPFLPLDKPRAPSSPSTSKPDSHMDPFTEAGEDEDDVWSRSISVPPVPPIPRTNRLNLVNSVIFSSYFDDDEDDETAEDNDDDGSSSSGGPSTPTSVHLPLAVAASSSASSTLRTYARDITGNQLRFDWAWIAAARLVIELNLRDLLMGRHQGVLRALLSLEGLRSCSAPSSPPCAPPEAEGEGEDGRVFKDGEGWDWAGVEGQWRCVTQHGSLCAETDSGALTDDVYVGWTIVTCSVRRVPYYYLSPHSSFTHPLYITRQPRTYS